MRGLKGAVIASGAHRNLRKRNELYDPEKSVVLKIFRRRVPMTDVFYGQKFVVRKAGVVLATPLLAVLVLVEITDIVFAVDSIPAIFAVTDEAFLVHRFIYLKIGLALLLDVYYISTTLSLGVIFVILATSIGTSLWATRGQPRHAIETPAGGGFRMATDDELAEVDSVAT